MAVGLVAFRIAVIQQALREASSAAECLPALAALLDVADELREDDLGGTGAARARTLLDKAVRYLRAASAALQGSGEDQDIALYLLARACLRRNDAAGLLPDADDAIACLRRLLAALPAADPDHAEVATLLTEALLARAGGTEGRVADVDEAGRLMASVLAALPPEHPRRRPVTAALAVARGLRYVGFAGTDADRDAAEAYAAATLAGADEPDEPASAAHLMLAWTALTRQQTAEQRSTMLRQAEIEAARVDAEAAARLLTAYGELQVSAADAETAIGHLRQISPDACGPFTRTGVPLLWGLAQLMLLHAGAGVADGGQVAESLGSLAAGPETTEAERGELLAVRAALLAGQSATGAAGALGDAVSGLAPGHLLRSPMLGTLRSLLTRQVDEPGPADDLSARLDEIATVLDRLPHDDPEAAHAMTVLSTHILNASISNRNVLRQDRLFAQIERLASDLAPGDPLEPYAGFLVSSARYVRAGLAHESDRADAALREMLRHADLVPAGHAARPFVLSTVATTYMERHSISGDLRNLDLADQAIGQAFAEAAPGGLYAEGTELHGYLLYMRGHLRTIRAVYHPTLPRVNEAIEDMERAEATIGPAEASRIGLFTSLGTARLLRDRLTQPPEAGMMLSPAASDTFDRLLAEAEQTGRDSLEYPVLATQAAAGLMMRGLAAADVTQVDRAIALLAGVCAIPTLALRERPRMLEFHGRALHTRFSMTRDPRDLGNAIARLADARRAVEQSPGSPHVADVLQALASAYRSRGDQALSDVDRAVQFGLDGLRERARNVLLQDTDDNALGAARHAGNDAAEMARWFLARGREDAAVSAIELGRGMVLHAATWGTGVTEALAEAGYPELAREWTAQAARPAPLAPDRLVFSGHAEPRQDDDLRYRAMLALGGTPAEARLLSPPAIADIAAALAGSGADALVYLLPQDETGPGSALIVDNAGTVSLRPLHRLRGGSGTAVGEFLRTRRAAEQAAETASEAAAAVNAAAEPARPAALTIYAAAQSAFDAARAAWLGALDAVCDWAWQTVIGPLLQTLARRAGASSAPGTGGPRRIVLVPGGELGLIPWHAARRPVSDSSASGGVRYDYACRHSVISYASSARQFIDAAQRVARPWPEAPVLVSDAAPSLLCAMAEVAHLHAAHYPNGAVFGSARYLLPDPAARGAAAAGPGDVLAALPHGADPGASVLHFGCHGRVRVPVLGSSLQLGRGTRGEEVSVSVADILRQARTRQARPDGGGLVVLASCLTDVTEADYDEAVTLATAFLAAGSAGVVAARWSVPDAATALFMAAFHRFLNEGDGDPARALRLAQLWMLNPAREVPESWPKTLRDEASLDGQPAGPNLTSTEAWAGFTYQGR
jgi:tetratricopeptide (TPR) repeat protein